MADNVYAEIRTSECRECREPIRPGAKICIECNSHQGWRRHLAISGTVLALLVALISVATASVPVLIKAFHQPSSNATLTFSAVRGDAVYILASNGGDAPAIIVDTRIESLVDLSPSEFTDKLISNKPMKFVADVDDAQHGYLQPGYHAIAIKPKLEMRPATALSVLRELRNFQNAVVRRPAASLIVNVRQFDGETHAYSFSISASEMRKLISTHGRACERGLDRARDLICQDDYMGAHPVGSPS